MQNNKKHRDNYVKWHSPFTIHHLQLLFCFSFFIFHSSFCSAQFGKKPPVLGDTTGLAEVESKIDLFKPIVQDMTNKINACNSLDTIKIYASVVEQIDDTLINHLVPIFNGYQMLHPDQYQPLKDIQDLSNNILDTKKLDKAKKYGLKMGPVYDQLIKAK